MALNFVSRLTLPPLRTVYPWLVIVSGLSALAWSVRVTFAQTPDPRWLALAVMTLVSAVATVRMQAAPVSLSISDTFIFASLLLFGPAAATVVASIEGIVLSIVLNARTQRLMRGLFNIASIALAMTMSGGIMRLVDGAVGLGTAAPSVIELTLMAVVAVSAYFLINTGTVAIAIALESGQRVREVWRAHFMNLAFAYVAGGYNALLLAVFAPAFNWVALLLLAPLPVIIYASVSLWVGRANDRVEYLSTANRQYRATIEAFAHAVDAKDRVTHGHIRRVQMLCLDVARTLGCNEEGQIQAIEAASLLHDLGKLAIPEHILNKPGKLNEAEWERMKEHAAIGAEILAGVEFPYPVVPIVRHHHENWDGSGYPDGIRGEQIPLGARILSVVDCYDALTSDRPYRPALTREEALAIIRKRSGTMYDPAVVAGFESVAPEVVRGGEAVAVSETPAPVMMAQQPPADASGLTVAPVVAPWLDLGVNPDMACLAGPVLSIACRAAAAPAGVLLGYVPTRDALTPVVSVGLDRTVVDSLNMRLGERLSGWVGANLTVMQGADATLDFLGLESRFVAAISVPIHIGDQVHGVMTLYSDRKGAFDAAPVDTLQALVDALSRTPGCQQERPPANVPVV